MTRPKRRRGLWSGRAAMAGDILLSSPHIVGVGGSPRVGSTSRTALAAARGGAAAAGASCRLFWVRDLDLPLYNPQPSAPPGAHPFAGPASAADPMAWG